MKLSGEHLEQASIAGVQGPGNNVAKITLKRGGWDNIMGRLKHQTIQFAF